MAKSNLNRNSAFVICPLCLVFTLAWVILESADQPITAVVLFEADLFVGIGGLFALARKVEDLKDRMIADPEGFII